MFSFGLKIELDRLPELEKRLKMLQKDKLEVGMFDTSQHPSKHNQSNFTYVSLFRYLNEGGGVKGLTPRPALQLAFAFNPLYKSPLKKELQLFLKNIGKDKTQKHADKVLKSVGAFYRDKVAILLGDSSKLAHNTEWTVRWKESKGFKGQNPLIETGALRKKISYKIGDNTWEYGK